MLSEDGAAVVRQILAELSLGLRALPTEIPLNDLEKKIGVRSQNIGMAFTPYIDKPLLAKGIEARKCGRPVRIQLKPIANSSCESVN